MGSNPTFRTCLIWPCDEIGSTCMSERHMPSGVEVRVLSRPLDCLNMASWRNADALRLERSGLIIRAGSIPVEATCLIWLCGEIGSTRHT